MVMVVSTRAIEGDYRTRDMYGWADSCPDDDLLKSVTVTDSDGQTYRRKPTKQDRARARRKLLIAKIDARLAKKAEVAAGKRAKHRTNAERREKMLKREGLTG